MQKVLLFPLFPQVERSSGSIHKTSPASKRLHYTSSRCDQLRKKKTVSHIGQLWEIVIVVTCGSSPCVLPSQRARTSCATPALCVSKKLVQFSPSRIQHLHWYVLCVTFFDCPWERPFCAPVSCSHHVQIKCAKNLGRTSKKPSSILHSSRAQSRQAREILSAKVCHLGTASNMEWQKLSASHRSSCRCFCSGASVQRLPPALAGGTRRHFAFALTFF